LAILAFQKLSQKICRKTHWFCRKTRWSCWEAVFAPPVRARLAAHASPRLLDIASSGYLPSCLLCSTSPRLAACLAACFGAPLGSCPQHLSPAGRRHWSCTPSDAPPVPVCLLGAPPTGGWGGGIRFESDAVWVPMRLAPSATRGLSGRCRLPLTGKGPALHCICHMHMPTTRRCTSTRDSRARRPSRWS
jgi:hypothetical protein